MSPALHVCAGCKPIGAHSGGAALHERLAAVPPGEITIVAHTCLGPCGVPGRVALTAPGRWSWLLAGVDAEDLDDLADFISVWRASPDGRVAKADRPPRLRSKIIGRVPPHPGDIR